MTAEKILQSDILDILFEGKNKSYGAYELRRQYDKRMKKAIAGTFILIALVGFTYMLASGNTSNVVMADADEPTQLTQVEMTKPKPPEPEKPKQTQAARPNVATVNPSAPLIVPDEVLPETKMPDRAQIDTSAIGDVTKAGEATNTNTGVSQDAPSTGGGTGPGVIASVPETPPGPLRMDQVDQLPEFPGGKEALVRYMVNNLSSELEPGVKYVVRAMFIIDEEGNVSDAQILFSDDQGLNSQVLKAIKRMKRWKPGVQNGQSVAVRFVMPVTFVGAEE
ncbi:MAG: energy transducer TonB [Bacteroidota bacterium]